MNPSIAVSNIPNQAGGTLRITGSGFTNGGQVNISATNTPEHPAIETIAKTTATSGGAITVDVPFSWPGGQFLPGCDNGAPPTTTVTITATDVSSNSPTFATTNMQDCGTVWSESPA